MKHVWRHVPNLAGRELLGDYETDALGEIILTNCTPGTYLVQEVDTGDSGHLVDSTPQEIELSAGDGVKPFTSLMTASPASIGQGGQRRSVQGDP